MAAQKKNSIQINLLPQEDANQTTGGRVLRWLLSTFRYLVITTELIVIAAFLSRFFFDSRAADLDDEIVQKQEFIEAYSSFEADFRLTQKRLAVLSQMGAETNLVTGSTKTIVESLPSTVSLENIRIQLPQTINIEGTSQSERSLSQFMANLSSHSEFQSVNLINVETGTQNPFVKFNIQIEKTI